MTIYGYSRVSTTDQSTERQLVGVTVDKMFTDKRSGKNTNRPGFQALEALLVSGDVVIVHSPDRLARSIVDLRNIVDSWIAKGVTIRFHKDSLEFSPDYIDSPMKKMILNMLGMFAEFERDMIVSRTKEGLAVAKSNGVKLGRSKDESIDREGIKAALVAGGSIRSVAASYGVSTQTVQRIKGE